MSRPDTLLVEKNLGTAPEVTEVPVTHKVLAFGIFPRSEAYFAFLASQDESLSVGSRIATLCYSGLPTEGNSQIRLRLTSEVAAIRTADGGYNFQIGKHPLMIYPPNADLEVPIGFYGPEQFEVFFIHI